jgi:hypothetical protein
MLGYPIMPLTSSWICIGLCTLFAAKLYISLGFRSNLIYINAVLLMDVQSQLLLVFSLHGDADVHVFAQCMWRVSHRAFNVYF